MPRTSSKAVPEGNGPIPQQEEIGSDQPTLANWCRLFEERFERQLNGVKSRLDRMNELVDEMRSTKQRLDGLEQYAQQLRLAIKADVPSDTKTRERTEGAAAAVQAKHEDSCSAKPVGRDPMCLTGFGDDSTGPSALSCSRDINALVVNGAATPKPCLSLLEIRTLTAAGGLLPTSTTSTAMRTTFDQPSHWFCPIEEMKLRTSIHTASSCIIFWRVNN